MASNETSNDRRIGADIFIIRCRTNETRSWGIRRLSHLSKAARGELGQGKDQAWPSWASQWPPDDGRWGDCTAGGPGGVHGDHW